MKFKFSAIFFFILLVSFAQEEEKNKNWIRSGFVYGFAAQNKIIKQDSDYLYESQIYKWSNHFHVYKIRKHAFELSIEPSYYRSKHKSFNRWQAFYTSSSNPEYYWEIYSKLKDINEYVLDLGIIYRLNFNDNLSIYALGNVGPMYIDTDTEMLKKGFAFSDIFAIGTNYKMNKFSFDVRMMARHVSNLNFQKPNYGLNSIGFEFGTYYELK